MSAWGFVAGALKAGFYLLALGVVAAVGLVLLAVAVWHHRLEREGEQHMSTSWTRRFRGRAEQ